VRAAVIVSIKITAFFSGGSSHRVPFLRQSNRFIGLKIPLSST
jgi:hypothetical protein